MMKLIKALVRSIAMDRRLVSGWLLLLGLHLASVLLLYDVIPEFDIVTHFIFGFLLSESISKGAHSIGLDVFLAEKMHKNELVKKNPGLLDFCIRLSGFLLIGGLFWESVELLSLPLIGRIPDPFLTFPITLHNIDGALDVFIGAVGCTVAYGVYNQ